MQVSDKIVVALIGMLLVMLYLYLAQGERLKYCQNQINLVGQQRELTQQCTQTSKQYQSALEQCTQTSKQYQSALDTCEETNKACFRFFTALNKGSSESRHDFEEGGSK